MCAGYGIEGLGRDELLEASGDAEAGVRRRVRFEAIPPLDEPASGALLRRWAAEQQGRARITGRIARNLNPLIRAPRDERELVLGWWWLHVGGAPAEYSAFNSRDDKLLRSWREPFQRRALLPATWYVEKGRRFELSDGEPFGIAAITTSVPAPEGELVTYSMVTRAAVGEASAVHHRMPLVLPPGFHDDWLDAGRPGDAALVDEALLASEAISRALVATDAERCERPQPTLF